MLIIYIDADACPVRDEVYRVATRYSMRVVVVANTPLRVPTDSRVELVVRAGFGVVDDWIAGQVGPGDIVITTDIPLAARCLQKHALVIDSRGIPFSENDIGEALATRELMDTLRNSGSVTGGPRPMTKRDRSQFLSTLDEAVNAVRRAYPPPVGCAGCTTAARRRVSVEFPHG